MIVQLDSSDAKIVEADDCRRLHVTAPSDVDVDTVLERSGLGVLIGTGEALLVIPELHRRAASAATAADWPAEWQTMIDYAAAKGWVTADRVRAHIERI